jgi:hypothetical protein
MNPILRRQANSSKRFEAVMLWVHGDPQDASLWHIESRLYRSDITTLFTMLHRIYPFTLTILEIACIASDAC